MNTFDRPSAWFSRSLKKPTQQESKLEDTAKNLDMLRAPLDSQQRNLGTFLASLNVE